MYGYTYYDSYNGERRYNIFKFKDGESISDVESEFIGSSVAVGQFTFESYEDCEKHCYPKTFESQ